MVTLIWNIAISSTTILCHSASMAFGSKLARHMIMHHNLWQTQNMPICSMPKIDDPLSGFGQILHKLQVR